MSAERNLFEIPVFDISSEFSTPIDPSESVSLPNEIPAPPALSQLPSSILHSATVETLLGQNNDLQARLTFTIRLGAQLERKVLELEQEQAHREHVNTSILAQLQIAEEKEKVWKNRMGELEVQLEQKNRDLSEQMSFSQAVHRQLQDRNSAFEALKNRLLEASSHMASQDKALRDLQTQMNIEFEERLQSALTECQRLNDEMKPLQERSERLEALTQKQIETENRAVYAERRAQELELKFANETNELQSHLTTYRTEAKTLAVKLHSSESEITELKSTLKLLGLNFEQVRDQFESLQTLWHESQKKLEDHQLRNEALQKINLELSRKLKDQRKIETSFAFEGKDSNHEVEL